jgi:hypothetical protein
MTWRERKGNNDVLRTTMLGALLAMSAIGVADAAKRPAPDSLTCRSDGGTNQLSLVYLPLPSRFKSVTGTMSRPRMGNGNYLLRVVLVDANDPPSHATGLISQQFPPLPKPGPLHGYGFALQESADSGKQTRAAANKWLIVPDEFQVRMTSAQDSTLAVRLTWDLSGEPRDYQYAVETVRSDYRRLAIACWNGDFELSNIRFEAQ